MELLKIKFSGGFAVPFNILQLFQISAQSFIDNAIHHSVINPDENSGKQCGDNQATDKTDKSRMIHLYLLVRHGFQNEES